MSFQPTSNDPNRSSATAAMRSYRPSIFATSRPCLSSSVQSSARRTKDEVVCSQFPVGEYLVLSVICLLSSRVGRAPELSDRSGRGGSGCGKRRKTELIVEIKQSIRPAGQGVVRGGGRPVGLRSHKRGAAWWTSSPSSSVEECASKRSYFFSLSRGRSAHTPPQPPPRAPRRRKSASNANRKLLHVQAEVRLLATDGGTGRGEKPSKPTRWRYSHRWHTKSFERTKPMLPGNCQ